MRPRQPSGLVPWHRRWEPSVVAPAEVEPVRIDAAGSVAGVSTAAALLLAAVIAVKGGLAAAYFVFVCVGSAAVIVITMIRNRHNHVLATPDGLVVVTRRGRALHPWTDMLEVGWMSPLPVFPPQRPGVVIRPAAASSWAVPGPNAPTRAATLAVYGRRGRRRACDPAGAGVFPARCPVHHQRDHDADQCPTGKSLPGGDPAPQAVSVRQQRLPNGSRCPTAPVAEPHLPASPPVRACSGCP